VSVELTDDEEGNHNCDVNYVNHGLLNYFKHVGAPSDILGLTGNQLGVLDRKKSINELNCSIPSRPPRLAPKKIV
jgi:hypothetical protein